MSNGLLYFPAVSPTTKIDPTKKVTPATFIKHGTVPKKKPVLKIEEEKIQEATQQLEKAQQELKEKPLEQQTETVKNALGLATLFPGVGQIASFFLSGMEIGKKLEPVETAIQRWTGYVPSPMDLEKIKRRQEEEIKQTRQKEKAKVEVIATNERSLGELAEEVSMQPYGEPTELKEDQKEVGFWDWFFVTVELKNPLVIAGIIFVIVLIVVLFLRSK